MQPILRQEVNNLYDYEKTRAEFRARIIELKKRRRVSVGPKVTLVFENRDTVLFQIQEMIRAERLVEEGKIQEEIDVYNTLIPPPDALSATLFIEIQELHRIKPEIESFIGLDRGNRLRLEFGEVQIPAVFEEGHSTEFRISAVQYVAFRFRNEQKQVFCRRQHPVSLCIDHPNYQHRTELPPEAVEQLCTDLLGAGS